MRRLVCFHFFFFATIPTSPPRIWRDPSMVPSASITRRRTMLTHEENELLSRVGPGTPAGELLRRYWYPLAFAQTLTEEQPTQYVRLLGEDLVLFKDKSGNVGLIADHCAHRGASL